MSDRKKAGDHMEHDVKNDSQSPDDLKRAERAVDRAFTTGKVDRAQITKQAQLDAAEAVSMVGMAMELDEEVDEAVKLTIITNNMGDRQKMKLARERAHKARKQAKQGHKAATKSAKQAYQAIKFSDPNSLGLMRVVQVAFLLEIAFLMLELLFTSRDTIAYTPSTLLSWVMVVLEAVAFYFFVNRYKVGRYLCIGIAAFGIVARLAISLIDGSFSIGGYISSASPLLLLMLYFIFSDRVKAVLVNDLSHDRGAMDDTELVIDRKSWPFYRNLIIYFVVFSVLGHWLEAGYCQLIRLGIAPGEFHAENTMLWRDWFYPYPMHGTAVVLMALILYPLFVAFKKKFKSRWAPYVVSYLTNVITVTLIELAGGLMFNAQLQNWDYTNMPFNFMGQVCLTNSLLFGVAASVISWWVYPMLERAIARVKPATMNIVCVVIAVAGGILFSLYAISPPGDIDLGSNAEQIELIETLEDYGSLQNGVYDLQSQLNFMEKSVDASKSLNDEERNKIKDHLDTLKKEVGELQADISQQSNDSA